LKYTHPFLKYNWAALEAKLETLLQKAIVKTFVFVYGSVQFKGLSLFGSIFGNK